ncbi:hypothetical protein M9Y10_020422 [Tritrichomonas musculus]|uniref:Myb-like DNA-binding domain containing protein n=1 Tax=Tritrichomonas musculus TaxID=1915356 RepID=A0ABR2HI55_9EUKA
MRRAKRLPFTTRENMIIKKAVKSIGEDWAAIAKKLPGRTPKQIHDRYINYLRDNLRTDPWTTEEDEVLIKMYKIIGPKWSKMISCLPGRSGNDIKNRWHKHIMKRGNLPYQLIDDQPPTKNNNNIDLPKSEKFNIPQLDFRKMFHNNPFASEQKAPILKSQQKLNDKFFQNKSPLIEPIINQYNAKTNAFDNNQMKPSFLFDKNIHIKKCIIDSSNLNRMNDKEHNFRNNFGESNKVDDFTNSKNLFSSNSSIFSHEYELQKLFDEIYSQNMDFGWI